MKRTVESTAASATPLTAGIMAACVACALGSSQVAWSQTGSAGGAVSSTTVAPPAFTAAATTSTTTTTTPIAGSATTATASGVVVTRSGSDDVRDPLRAQQRIGADFTAFAGSAANANALVAGLRTGSSVTLAARPGANAATTGTTATTAPGGLTFTPATGPMGNGNVTIALALAKEDLARQGIRSPTPQQITAALNGGSVSVGNPPRTVQMPGVLALRSQGMGWGRVASAIGVKLGPVMTGLKTANTPAASVRRAGPERQETGHGIVSADGAARSSVTRHEHVSARSSVVTAAGGGDQATSRGATHAAAAASSRGIVTAAGTPALAAVTTGRPAIPGAAAHGHDVATARSGISSGIGGAGTAGRGRLK